MFFAACDAYFKHTVVFVHRKTPGQRDKDNFSKYVSNTVISVNRRSHIHPSEKDTDPQQTKTDLLPSIRDSPYIYSIFTWDRMGMQIRISKETQYRFLQPLVRIVYLKLDMEGRACNLSTWEVETGGSRVQGKLQLHRSSWPAWATWYPMIKAKKKKRQ